MPDKRHKLWQSAHHCPLPPGSAHITRSVENMHRPCKNERPQPGHHLSSSAAPVLWPASAAVSAVQTLPLPAEDLSTHAICSFSVSPHVEISPFCTSRSSESEDLLPLLDGAAKANSILSNASMNRTNDETRAVILLCRRGSVNPGATMMLSRCNSARPRTCV